MRYFIGLLVTAGLLIILIVLLVTHTGSSSSKAPNTSTPFTSYATTDATVSLTIDGPIVASQNHNSVVITVGQNSATVQVIQGYDGDVTSSKTYPNTSNGYSAFLHALSLAGFTNGNTSKALAADETGYCPEGDRYVFALNQDGKNLEQFWSSGCSGTHTYDGDSDLTTDLFKAQIPDYDALVDNANL
jgi:hypothetical protein